MNDLAEKNIMAVIAEYNPMQNGHFYQLNKCKEICKAQYTIAIMSGNFTQRGTPAIFDKYMRSEIAVKNGIDLVLELPFYYACNSAEYFARGAIKIADSLGIVTHLGFGSECDNISTLTKVAEIIEHDKEFEIEIKKYIKQGLNYPTAKEKAIRDIWKTEKIENTFFSQPNNTLAIEYIRQILRRKSNIKPIAIKRNGKYIEENLEECSGNNISATAIRQSLKDRKLGLIKEYVSDATYQFIEKNISKCIYHDNEKLFELLKFKIMTSTRDEIKNIFSVKEGLENKIFKEVRYVSSREELINAIKSKRYTRTNIERLLTHIMIGFNKEEIEPNYSRILAFNKKGAELLKEIKKNKKEDFIVFSKLDKNIEANLDVRAMDIYNLIAENDTYCNCEYVRKPYMIF